MRGFAEIFFPCCADVDSVVVLEAKERPGFPDKRFVECDKCGRVYRVLAEDNFGQLELVEAPTPQK